MSFIHLGEFTPLLNILPGNHNQQQKSKDLYTLLAQYTVVLKLATNALQALQEGQFHQFDGLVGENACQIRAVLITDISQQINLSSNMDDYLQRIHDILTSIKLLQTQNNSFSRQSFRDLLEAQKLQLELPQWLLAATLAYQLCITKISNLGFTKENGIIVRSSHEQTNFSIFTKKLENCPKLSHKFFKNIDKIARETLSQLSIQYVQQVFNSVSCSHPSEDDSLLKALIYEEKDDGNGRSTIPCFAFMDILLRYAFLKQIPILLNVKVVDPETLELGKNLPLYYQPNENSYAYLENFNDKPLKQGLIVMEGYSMGSSKLDEKSLKQKLISIPLENNILGNDAAHHQYAGDKEDLKRPTFDRCEKYRQIAIQQGFCKENPVLCYIDHVYSDTLEHLYKEGLL